MSKKFGILAAMALLACMGGNENVYENPPKNNSRRRYKDDFGRRFQIPQMPHYKFIPEYKVLIFLKETPSGYLFTFHGNAIFLSSRKTSNNAWQDFIKNFWYVEKNREFQKLVWNDYKEIVDQSMQKSEEDDTHNAE